MYPIVFDGEFEAAREFEFENNVNSHRSVIAGIPVVTAEKIRILAEVTPPREFVGGFSNIHVAVDDRLYEFENVLVECYEDTTSEEWTQIEMSASSVSVRNL